MYKGYNPYNGAEAGTPETSEFGNAVKRSLKGLMGKPTILPYRWPWRGLAGSVGIPFTVITPTVPISRSFGGPVSMKRG